MEENRREEGDVRSFIKPTRTVGCHQGGLDELRNFCKSKFRYNTIDIIIILGLAVAPECLNRNDTALTGTLEKSMPIKVGEGVLSIIIVFPGA